MKTDQRFARASSAGVKIKRILVPVDFSAASNHAVEHARLISALTGGQLIFLHIIVPNAPVGCEPLPSTCADELRNDVAESLRALLRKRPENGALAATSQVRFGFPAHEIVETAKDSDADLIVIATHGYTGWKHFCIGSTAERVVRAAPCSVLVVREKEHPFS